MHRDKTPRKLPLIWTNKMPRATSEQSMQPVERLEKHPLYKLVLTVAQACNLRCTYCYAEGGPYGSDVSRMTDETAARAIRSMFTRYEPIRTLQFFGGEPTLNLPAMKAAVATVRAMVAEGIIAHEPCYAIVTNALRLTDELIDFYKDTKMKITASHDGPAEVQNMLRPGLTGEGSSDEVNRNLARLRQNGIEFDVQCTFTRKHMLAGYTVPRLLRHFHEIGAGKINIVPVTVPPNDELDVFFSDVFADMVRDYQEAVRLTFAAKRAGVVVRFGMVEETLTLLRKDKLQSKHYCQAGVSTLTVGANGDVYPCFMFINKEGFHLGHVDGDHQLAAFARDPKHGVDFGCPGRQFMMNGKITPFRPDEILKNAVVDTVLDCLNELLDDLEVTYGLRASDASSSSAVQSTSSAKSLAPA